MRIAPWVEPEVARMAPGPPEVVPEGQGKTNA